VERKGMLFTVVKQLVRYWYFIDVEIADQ
jgi:hypothetical protein